MFSAHPTTDPGVISAAKPAKQNLGRLSRPAFCYAKGKSADSNGSRALLVHPESSLFRKGPSLAAILGPSGRPGVNDNNLKHPGRVLS